MGGLGGTSKTISFSCHTFHAFYRFLLRFITCVLDFGFYFFANNVFCMFLVLMFLEGPVEQPTIPHTPQPPGEVLVQVVIRPDGTIERTV